ncbi:MAG: hypothetical protein ACLTDR_02560 [Adlercreutzia equolifaciens]
MPALRVWCCCRSRSFWSRAEKGQALASMTDAGTAEPQAQRDAAGTARWPGTTLLDRKRRGPRRKRATLALDAAASAEAGPAPSDGPTSGGAASAATIEERVYLSPREIRGWPSCS